MYEMIMSAIANTPARSRGFDNRRQACHPAERERADSSPEDIKAMPESRQIMGVNLGVGRSRQTAVLTTADSQTIGAPQVTYNDALNAAMAYPNLVATTSDQARDRRDECPHWLERPQPLPYSGQEEVVVDDRARLRPAQLVELKLTRMLQVTSLPVSHLQMRGLLRVR
jgi:hypothetical protein